MNCENLITLKDFKGQFWLVAGDGGLKKKISWIYFADTLQCLRDDMNVSDFLNGNELVIMTNTSLTDDEEKVMKVIRAMYEKHISALFINDGQISKGVIDFCNSKGLPLFALSLEIRLLDFSKLICEKLLDEEKNTSTKERLLYTILYSDSLDIDQVLLQAEQIGVSLSGKCKIIYFKIFEGRKKQDFVLLNSELTTLAETEFINHGIKRVLTLTEINAECMLISDEMASQDLLTSILENIIKKAKSEFKINLKIGIGSSYEYIRDFRKSMEEAKSAVKFSKMFGDDRKIIFYDDIDIYSLITMINDGAYLDSFVEKNIGKLISADENSEADLINTLSSYISHNLNMNETANSLYIHRNTLHYRLEKIKNILNMDLNDIDNILTLKLSLAIYALRGSKKG